MKLKNGWKKVCDLYSYYAGLSFACYVITSIGGIAVQGWIVPFLLLYTYGFLYESLSSVTQDVMDFERQQEICNGVVLRVTPFMYSTVVILFCGTVELNGGFDRIDFVIPLLLLFTYNIMLWMIVGVEEKIKNIELKNRFESMHSAYKIVRVIIVAYVAMMCCMLFYDVVGSFAVLLFITHGVLGFHINVLASRVERLRLHVL
ncbi:hypothetical protein AGMMS50225_02360 [Betaproteobacteria bacterium]|nr:hypothetical protein AGMMS50225_02360 [Betaproteobacteria bacterium]